MMNNKKYKRAAIIIAILLIIYLIFHHSPKEASTPAAPSVVVQKPVLIKISNYITQTGNSVAYNSVDLVARIDGYLTEIKFKDGSFVKKDDLLFVIEPEPYAEKLLEAKANLDAKKSEYTYAKTEYERQRTMYKQNATSLNNVQKWMARRDQTKAEIDKAAASVKIAEINYSYTHVTAPFDGRIGRHLVDPGNFVGNGTATKLATIEQIDPIYVYFNLNELDLFKIREAARAEGLKPSEIDKVPVYIGLQNEVGFPHEGRLNFVNTGLNASTGTMEFRALLTNKNYAILPGLFVQIRIALDRPIPHLTVPDNIVQYDQLGAYVLVIDKDNNVTLKRVMTGSVEKGMRIILKGLNPQDNVVVEGLQNAIPGHKVTLQAAESIAQPTGEKQK